MLADCVVKQRHETLWKLRELLPVRVWAVEMKCDAFSELPLKALPYRSVHGCVHAKLMMMRADDGKLLRCGCALSRRATSE